MTVYTSGYRKDCTGIRDGLRKVGLGAETVKDGAIWKVDVPREDYSAAMEHVWGEADMTGGGWA